MSGWIIAVGVFVLVNLLIWITPVGAELGNWSGVMTVKLRIAFFRLTLLPSKPGKDAIEKKPDKKKKEQKKEKPPKEKKEPSGVVKALIPELEDIPDLLQMVRNALGRLGRGITIHRMFFDILCGGSDAAAVAILYGRLNSAFAAAWPMIHKTMSVKKSNAAINSDYSAEKPTVRWDFAVSIRIGTVLLILLILVVRYLQLTVFDKEKRKRRKLLAKAVGKQ